MEKHSMTPEQQAELMSSYLSGKMPTRPRQRAGCLGALLRLMGVGVFGVAVLYGVVAIIAPWAFHIGGRSTPFLTWHGYGQLLTKGGMEYPLYISLYPSSHSS